MLVGQRAGRVGRGLPGHLLQGVIEGRVDVVGEVALADRRRVEQWVEVAVRARVRSPPALQEGAVEPGPEDRAAIGPAGGLVRGGSRLYK